MAHLFTHSLQRIHLLSGDTLFQEGEQGDFAYILEEGEIDIIANIHGKKHTLNRLETGVLFGELALIDGRPRSATAIARTDCLLTVITPEQVERRLLSADPVLQMLLLSVTRYFRSEATRRMTQGSLTADAVIPNVADPVVETIEARLLAAVDLIRLECELRSAIEQQQFQLHYQPIVQLATGQVSGFEALIRWQSPTRGFVRPDRFMPLAEVTSLILPLGEWVIAEGCRVLQDLQRCVSYPLFISFNIASQQIQDPNFIPFLRKVVDRYQLQPKQIKLEILERSLVDSDEAIAWIEECQADGFAIALDDFGTGYSSLEYLKLYQFNTLKIDKTFVQDLCDNTRSQGLCQVIIQLAHTLNMTVVAEGVETEAQQQWLTQLNCTYGQGYLFSKALPHELLKPYLQQMEQPLSLQRPL
ncbi:MAG: EAL domain-containing protein [Thainema sp.]